mgnify:CR=1 FL=1
MILDDTDRLVLPDDEEDIRDGQSDLTPDQDSPVVDEPETDSLGEGDEADSTADDAVDVDEGDEDTEGDEGDDSQPQQAEKMYPKSVVDKIVERRLHRDRRAREKEFSQVAGMRLSNEDVKKAARLWGFLAKNPDLNARVHQIFQEYESSGRIRHDSYYDDALSERERELELREAIIDLRARDKVFRNHETEIMEWAEINGYDIEDERTLRLAVMAWKGENMNRFVSDAQKKAQEKAIKRAKQKRDAKLLPGKGVRKQQKLDYSKMTPEEILRAEGLSLFISDDPY